MKYGLTCHILELFRLLLYPTKMKDNQNNENLTLAKTRNSGNLRNDEIQATRNLQNNT